MDQSSKEFFEKIKVQKEQDCLIWNSAQEYEGIVIWPAGKEDEIMERMFLVNTIEKLEAENAKLKRALTDISKIDYLNIPVNRQYLKLQDAVIMAESMLDDLYNK